MTAPIVPDADPFPYPPTPLTGTRPRLPFPVDALPTVLQNEVIALAEATQTDPAMAATTVLTVLAAAVGGRCEIEVRPGWREGLNIFTATVAGPGERESAVQAELTRPLRDQEAVLAEAGAAIRGQALTLAHIAEKAADHAKAAAARAEGPEKDRLQADAVAAGLMADSLKVPAVPRILADDVTGEAAASLLAEQGGRIAVISAEGGIFDVIAGRYSGNVPHMDVWLKGHAGDPLRVDRKGREPEYIPRPALTVGLMIQGHVLATIGGNGVFRGRGLLARFLYCLPESKVGSRRAGAPAVPDDVTEQYGKLIAGLAADFQGWTDPAILTLDAKATAGVIIFEEMIEPQLAGNGELAGIADWGAKWLGTIMRIAGLLHVAEHGEPGHKIPVTVSTLTRAGLIGNFLKYHALAAFDEMRIERDVSDAVYLLDLIGKMGVDSVSRRDLFTAAYRGRFEKATDLDAPIGVLVDHGWLAPIERPDTPGPGRPPSPRWHVYVSAISAVSAQPLTQPHSADTADIAETSPSSSGPAWASGLPNRRDGDR
ncbi:MAG: YfjI family protein [Pseudonocardiales bacterium]